MASKVQICNLALTRLGAARITSLDETTQEAKNCNALFDLLAEEVMASANWPSVRRRSSLVQIADTPAFEFTYTYQLPISPKFLKLIYINEMKPGDIRYSIEGDKLLTNESSVKIKYIAFIADTNSYDIYLRQSIVDRLVAELTYATTGQSALYSGTMKYYNDHLKDLAMQAGVQDTSEFINSDTFIDARISDGCIDEGRDT